MSKPFFLTRQSANLMEDFIRELKADAGLYLIYGDEGVGKTRLLEELVRNRLPDCKIRWMDLKAGEGSGGALVDSSELIERTFARAGPGDVIVADHFETALKKSRHQLFLSWSTDGIDKQLNLIISSNSEFFNELRQMTQQYQVRVQSFQQMPFNADEAAAFLGFYLFPDRPIGKLSMPPLLRNQFAIAQGNVGKLIEIAERAGDQIGSEPMNDSQSIRKDSRVLVGVLVAVVLVVAVGWYYLSGKTQPGEVSGAAQESTAVQQASTEMAESPASEVPTESEASESAVVVADAPPVEAVDDAAVATANPEQNEGTDSANTDEMPPASPAPSPAPEPEQGSGAEVSGSSMAAVETGAPPATDDEIAAPAQAAVSQAESQSMPESNETGDAPTTTVDETVPDTDPETVKADAANLTRPATDGERLQQDLQSSLDWIASRDSKTGTLQIMLLSQEHFDQRVYYQYLERLASQGIDVSRVRIFETYVAGQEMLSIVYGEYPGRAAAAEARAKLQPELRKASPIARSVAGLMEEIRRLRNRN